MENVHSTTRHIYSHWKTNFTELIAIFINSKFVTFCLCWLEGFTHLVYRFFYCIKKITVEVTAGAPSLHMHFDGIFPLSRAHLHRWCNLLLKGWNISGLAPLLKMIRGIQIRNIRREAEMIRGTRDRSISCVVDASLRFLALVTAPAAGMSSFSASLSWGEPQERSRDILAR